MNVHVKLLSAAMVVVPFVATALFADEQHKDELVVTSITRISHPAYRANNQWYATRYPWNQDGTRVMIYESSNYQDAETSRRGRGACLGVRGRIEAVENTRRI